MASTYSTNLGIELIGTGDQSGTWGATTNTNFGTLVEQAIVGYSTQAVTDSGVATVLLISNGASSTGRNYVITLTGALTAARTVEVPAVNKPYIFFNSTTGGFAVTVKVTGQTGVVIANGKKAIVYTNTTDVIEVANAPATEAGTQTLTNKTLTAPVIATIVNTGTLTLPTSTDTLVGRATTDTLTNKTLTSPLIGTVIGGTTASSSLTLQSTSGVGTSDSILFKVGNNGATTAMTVDTSGNVGIGTSSPSTKTVINLTGGTSSYTNPLRLINVAGGASGCEIQFAGTYSATAPDNTFTAGSIGGLTTSGSSNGSGALIFKTQLNGTLSETMRIDSSGNVGIGCTPSYTLDVRATTGSISSTSTTGTNFAKLQCNNTGGSYQFGIDNSAGTNFGSGNAYARVIWNDSSTAPTILYTNSTERMRIDSSGNVGIGGTPLTKLTLFGTQTIRGSGTDGGIYTCLYMDEFTSPYASVLAGYILSLNTGGNNARTARIYIDQTGNVGIGTGTTPASTKLEVAGNVSAQQSNGRYFGFGVGGFSFDGTTVNDYGITYTTISSTYNTVLAAFSNIKFATSQQERMRIDSSGNVGIGTSSPGVPLQVNGNAVVSNLAFGTTTAAAGTIGSDTGFSGPRITFYGATYGSNAGTLSLTTAAAPIVFGTSNSEVMRIDSSGNVGIGTSSPAVTGLHVYNAGTPVIRLANSTVSMQTYVDTGYCVTGTVSNHPYAIATNNTTRMTIDTSGNVLVGTTSPANSSNTVFRSGSGSVVQNFQTDSTSTVYQCIFINPNGNVGYIFTNGSSTSYVTSSDYRMKNTIVPMTGALEKVALLKPCTYKWNVDGSNGQGFIAHELAEVEPNCVSGEKDAVDAEGNPQYQGIDTSFLVATLTAAIQELSAKNDALEARLAKLETVQ